MKASANIFPKVQFLIGAAPSPPAAGDLQIYAKSGGMYVMDSAGTETPLAGGGGGSGTVTSVGLAMPAALFNVASSPVSTSGTITVTFANIAANTFLAGPASGAAAAASLRAITPADVPVFVASGASHAAGLVPDPGATAGSTRFLCENGTFAVPAGSSAPTPLTQTTVASGSGSSMQYKSEPNLLYLANGNLLCAYRKGSSHINNDGQIVGKISTDNGATWGSEFVIYDDPSYDARNHMLGLDASSGKIVVFFRTYDTAVNHNVDTAYVTSTDNGATWSAKTSVASTLPASVDWCPFGRLTVSTLGWLATFYQQNKCYLLKSTDGGTTWTAQGYIYNLSQSAIFDEPNLIALDTSRLVLLVRDDESASYNLFRYYKSNDGGATWAFSPGIQYTTSSQSLGCPCYAVRISDRKVGVVFAARTDTNAVCYSVVNLSAFAQIPYVGWDGTTSQRPARNILYFARKKWDTTVSSVTDSDFGYAFPVLIPNTEQVLIAWYDTGDGTNLNCSIFIAGAPLL